jgi:SNF2 family DNA or RNA helicase
MGVGKTPILSVAAGRRIDEVKKPALVTAPAYLLPQWRDFIHEWVPGATVAIANGDGRVARNAAFDAGADFVLSSYHNWTARPEYPQLSKTRWGVHIFDEAHRLRGRNSQWTAAVYRQDNADARNHGCPMWFGTGTPIVRDAGDVYPFLHLCDRKVHSSYWTFVQNWCHLEETPWDTVIGRVKDPKAFYEMLSRYSHRRVLDFGEPDVVDIPVELPKSVRDMIKRAKKEFIFEHPDMEYLEMESAGAVWGRIRQLTSVPPTAAQPKMEALVGRLEDLPNERALIACWYRATADAAMDKIRRVRPKARLFTGDVKPGDKVKAIDEYNEHDEGTIVCTIASLKEGANLQAGRHVIFLEESELPSDNDQLIGRTLRRGQTRPVIVTRIYAAGSIDLAVRKLASGRAANIQEVMREFLWDPS